MVGGRSIWWVADRYGGWPIDMVGDALAQGGNASYDLSFDILFPYFVGRASSGRAANNSGTTPLGQKPST
jgi:hypothetical protein